MKCKLNLITTTLIGLTFFFGCSNSNNNTAAVNSLNTADKVTNGSNAAIVTNNTNASVTVSGNANMPIIIPGNANTSVTVTKNAKIPAARADAEFYSKINLENFIKLEKGMKYADVVKLLGSEGENIGETDIPGAKSVMYKWSGASNSFIKIFFQNDKLIEKVHTGLK